MRINAQRPITFDRVDESAPFRILNPNVNIDDIGRRCLYSKGIAKGEAGVDGFG
jgi:hypothetical protein